MSDKLKWILILAAGWVLGWYSNQFRDTQTMSSIAGPDLSVHPVATEPDACAKARRQDRYPAGKDMEVHETGYQDALEAHRYRQAMQILYSQPSDVLQKQHRAALIAHLNSLLERKDYAHAGQLLSIYLEREYRDVEILLIRARLYALQGDYRAVIDTLYEAKSYAYQVQEIERIERKIRKVVGEYHRTLEGIDAPQKRLTLYQHLTRLEPDYSPYFIELASAQLSLEQLDAARQSLFLVEADPLVAERAQRLLKRIENRVTFSQAAPVSIPLVRRGEHYVVEGWLNGTVSVRLLIDTGASTTVIRKDVLRAAGVSGTAETEVYQFSTANGPVLGKVYRVAALSIAEQNVENIRIAALELPELQDVDGLLGMNYLKHFRFFIDQDRQELRLSAPL